jgi:hypothetical protein
MVLETGQEVVPIVLKALRSKTTELVVDGRRNSYSLSHHPSHNPSQSETNANNHANSEPTFCENNAADSSSVSMESRGKGDKHKMIIAIYSIMERTYEVPASRESGSLDMFQNCGADVFPAYLPCMVDIVMDCVMQLNESQNVTVLLKVLGITIIMIRFLASNRS